VHLVCASPHAIQLILEMRQDSQNSGRRRRRGPRRGGSPSGGPRTFTPAKPKTPTLWEKIASFFSRGGSTSHDKPRAAVPERSRERPEESGQRSARKPELVEVSSPKLYVGNLSFDATESDLFDLFNGIGKVQNAEIVSHKYTQKSKGFAFVLMQTTDEARRAVVELHDKDFMGRKLVVSGAKAGDVRNTA